MLAEGRTVIAGPAEDVLDPDVLASVYDTKVDIVEHDGRRIVLPRREGR